MIISIIVAISENYAIGKDNKLLFKLQDDLKRFKKLTTGHTIIMGRTTYYSLPNKPLRERTNIVITDDPKDHFDGCVMACSIDDALSKCSPDETECFIIGGGTIYRQFFEKADKLYLSKVKKTIHDADTFFPEINYNDWKLIYSEEFTTFNPPYSFLIYERNK